MANPSNDEVAHLLEQLGKLLEISGESSFRVRAYGKAAESIRDSPDSVATLANHSRLKELDGVGEGIAGVITEYIRTGRVLAYEELQQRFPLGLLEVLGVPGLGAKTAAKLYQHLGIASLDELQAAGEKNQLAGMPGITNAGQTRILEGIAALKRRTGRIRLGQALPYARRLVDLIALALPGSAVSLAGSVRRMDETVSDIDLVLSTADAQTAFNTLATLDLIAKTDYRDDGFARFRLQNGMQLDVVAAFPTEFGTKLIQATGNNEHLNRLGVLPTAANEGECYDKLGLPFIPPELRQGRFEFDLAHGGGFDRLVTIADIRGEFHCHTTWSDGALPVDQMVLAAKEQGYAFIGISDHTRSLGVANGLTVERLLDQRIDIDEANRVSGLRVFSSAEVEVHRDGSLDFDDETLAGLDIVIASTHVGLRQPRDELTERLIGVLENPNVDIIAHPSGRLLERREPGDFDWNRVFETTARTGTVLEINADPARMDLKPEHAREAIEAGCLLTINCDAHHPDGWLNLEYGIANARKAGVRADQVINTWAIERIDEWRLARGK
jgi:DNA polymerase (family 10)